MLSFSKEKMCLLLACLIGFGCVIKKKQGKFSLSGSIRSTISNNNKKYLLLSYTDRSQNQIIDTIFSNKKFKITGNINGAVMCSISLGELTDSWTDENSFNFFLAPSKIKLILDKDSLKRTTILGSKSQTEYEDLELKTGHIYKYLDPLIVRRNSLLAGNREIKDSAINNEINRIGKIQEIKLLEIKELIFGFIDNHPDSYLSSFWLNFYKKDVPINYVKLNYSKFSDEVRSGFYGLNILEYIKKIESTVILNVGDTLSPFKLKDVNGNITTLNSVKGKTHLIVFWASWCGPCRDDIPVLKDLYRKYSSSKFDMISISLDDKESNWAKAIKSDKPQWMQLSDIKGFESDLVSQLDIKAIPNFIIINADGVIISKNLKINELDSKLSEL